MRYLIGITNRGKYADVFWFSLLHELGYVLQKKITKILVDFESYTHSEDYEKEADQFAKDLLVDPQDFEMISTKGFFSKQEVQDFADAIKIHPGIVVGRLQKEGLLPYTHLNGLRQKYVFNK